MIDVVELWEQPEAKEIYMIAGWRQWADAGSMSSLLPQYLINQMDAHQIGKFISDKFYLFQIPGTHDLVRPTVHFEDGFPVALDTPRNEIFYTGNSEHGLVIFLGDEPQLNMEGYADAFLHVARTLRVKRIVSTAGVYGEFPYNKERMMSAIYSQRSLKEELSNLAVNLSDYKGGASVGSYLCRRASEQDMQYVGLYAFVPTFDFSRFSQLGTSLRIEEDYMAWLGALRRIKFMLHLSLDLADITNKSERLKEVLDKKVSEIENLAPQVEIREYLEKLEAEFTEVEFSPLDDVWEQELRRLLDDEESDEK